MTEKPKSSIGLNQKFSSGLFWTSISFGLWKIISFVSIFILARLLSPRDFGLVGIAIIAIGTIRMFQDMGIGCALIYEKGSSEKLTSTAFYLILISGLFFTAASYFSADYIALFFKNKDAAPILKLLSVNIMLASIGTVPSFLLTKELRFKKRTIPETTAALAQAVVSITMALTGYGVWSLVYGELASRAVNTVAAWMVCSWRPKLVFDFKVAKGLYHYSKFMVGSSITSFATSNADNMIVARILGASSLGYYSLAFRTASLPTTLTFFVVSKVTFPIFSKLQDDTERLAAAFLKTIKYLAFFSLFAGVVMYMLAPNMLNVLVGAKWGRSVAPLRGLILYGFLTSIILQAIEIFKATGRPNLSFRAESIRLLILIPLAIIGAVYGGILGVALAQSLTVVIAIAFYFRPMLRSLGITAKDFILSLIPATVPSVVTVLLLTLMHLAFQSGLLIRISSFLYLGTSLVAAAMVLSVSFFLLDQKTAIALTKKILPSRGIAGLRSTLNIKKGNQNI